MSPALCMRLPFPITSRNPRNSGFGRWTRIFFVLLPIAFAVNYLIIFQWTYFEDLSKKIWPDASFHPPAYPHSGPLIKDNKDYWLWDTHTDFLPRHEEPATNWNVTTDDDDCAVFPRHLFEKIQVTLKTGAADNWDRTSSQLDSVIKCIPNIFIVSDLSHAYGPKHNATDVLASLPPSTVLKPEDLEVYERQRNASIEGLTPGHDGWKIDKYKFLPEVEEAVKRNPKAEWFVFLESDTYVFWDNMFRLLQNYDPQHPYYFGSPSPGKKYHNPDTDKEDKVWFAYGGTGFVLSGVAAHRLVDRSRNGFGVKAPRVTEEYKEFVRNDCCGDSMLGWALHDRATVDISGLWPMFNPHGLHAVPFGKHYWCEPVLSLHKSHPEDFARVWDWENSRDRTQGPLLYKDLIEFHHLGTITRKDDWDNADWDGFNEEDAAHPSNQSFESCRDWCHAHEQCYQFTWHGHHCWMSKAIKMGQAKRPDGHHSEEDRRYISGWDVEKIQKWKQENTCAEGGHWVKPSIERKF